ncbi:MAG: hypothetical protein QNJ98_09885 [Planctomycetota bacterium]|nr:hypothetical protein [Planctomycetota bacterium]
MRMSLAAVLAAALLAGCCCPCPEAPCPPDSSTEPVPPSAPAPEPAPAPETPPEPTPPEPPTEASPDPATPIVIVLSAEGAFVARHGQGEGAPLLAEGDLGAAAGAEAQQAVLDGLRNALRDLSSQPGMREADGSSKLKVLVEGDRDAKWQYVQWLMQAMAHPDLKIYKMQFRVRGEAESGSDR